VKRRYKEDNYATLEPTKIKRNLADGKKVMALSPPPKKEE